MEGDCCTGGVAQSVCKTDCVSWPVSAVVSLPNLHSFYTYSYVVITTVLQLCTPLLSGSLFSLYGPTHGRSPVARRQI